jgi:Coenzyme PQQ synthesis protein D (PqqD)
MTMLSLSSFVAPNEQQVAAKVMDGEAILINLATGTYYSMPATGGFIWSLIERNLSLNDIVSGLSANYDADRQQLESDVVRLCQELCDEGLLTISTTGIANDSIVSQTGNRLPYQAPTIEKFTDMAEMFALDPPLPGLAATGPAKRA